MSVVFLLTAVLFGFGLGAQLRGRSRFNAGVAAGRESERLEHGWRDDPALLNPPRRRSPDFQYVTRSPRDATPRVLDDF